MNKKLNFSLHFAKSGGETAIFSLPQSNHYHTINHLQVGKNEIIEEAGWKNKVVIISQPNNTISFRAKLNNIEASIPEELTADSYKRIPKLLISPNRFINGKDPKIISLAQKVVDTEQNLSSAMRKLYDFTLNYLTYGKPIDGLYTYKQAVEGRIIDCGGFSTFLASLLQSLGIPLRLVAGFLIKNDFIARLKTFNFSFLTFNFLMMHAWLEVLLPNNVWFPLDPSIEWRRQKGLTVREGGFGYIPSDRLVTSFGEDFEINLNDKTYKIDLLQKPVYL